MNLIKSLELSQSRKTAIKSVYPRNKGCKSSSSLEVGLNLVFIHPRVLLTLVMAMLFRGAALGAMLSRGAALGAIASMTVLGINHKAVMAQTPSTPKSTTAGVKSISQVQVLFVNPNMGDDKPGNGQQQSPLRTITQAIQVAQPNTTIVLSPGTYSQQTGEKFPLFLKSGVSLQGDPQNKGRGIIIQGGGDYLSRFFGSKNVAVIGANQSAVKGITITNTNPRGYALWIESGNMEVSDNTFTGNSQDGIAVMGKAEPTIVKNNFFRNSANGITISGNAKPQIRENVFQQTGFGINVAENAQPLIVANSIQYNRSGIIIQANSRPVLRNNLIQGNQEDGLVAIYQAIPDLGNNTEAGGNKFSNNGRYDINASAAKQTLVAYGNDLGRDKIAGQVDFSGAGVASTANLSTPTVANNPTSTRRLLTLPNNTRTEANTNSSSQFTSQLPSLPTQSNTSQPDAVRKSRLTTPRNFTPRQTLNSLPANASNNAQLNYIRLDNQTIEFTAPKSAAPSLATTPRQVNQQNVQVLDTTPTNASLLPVPGANVPGMDNGNIINQTPGNYGNTVALSSTNNADMSSRYRVMVPIQTQRDQEIVRFLAPDAFPTVWQGQAYMQAGVFSSRYNADNMQKILNSNGLRAVIQPASN